MRKGKLFGLSCVGLVIDKGRYEEVDEGVGCDTRFDLSIFMGLLRERLRERAHTTDALPLDHAEAYE